MRTTALENMPKTGPSHHLLNAVLYEKSDGSGSQDSASFLLHLNTDVTNYSQAQGNRLPLQGSNAIEETNGENRMKVTGVRHISSDLRLRCR